MNTRKKTGINKYNYFGIGILLIGFLLVISMSALNRKTESNETIRANSFPIIEGGQRCVLHSPAIEIIKIIQPIVPTNEFRSFQIIVKEKNMWQWDNCSDEIQQAKINLEHQIEAPSFSVSPPLRLISNEAPDTPHIFRWELITPQNNTGKQHLTWRIRAIVTESTSASKEIERTLLFTQDVPFITISLYGMRTSLLETAGWILIAIGGCTVAGYWILRARCKKKTA